MISWILILVITNFKHHTATSTYEFKTKESCEKAAKHFNKKSSHFHKYDATCFENKNDSETSTISNSCTQ